MNHVTLNIEHMDRYVTLNTGQSSFMLDVHHKGNSEYILTYNGDNVGDINFNSRLSGMIQGKNFGLKGKYLLVQFSNDPDNLRLMKPKDRRVKGDDKFLSY